MCGTTASIRKRTSWMSSCPGSAQRLMRSTSASRPSAASATFFVPMLEKLRRSLALRLAAQYALVFALSAVFLFGVLYWVLARALERRDQEVVERRADLLER